MNASKRIIVALDQPDSESAFELISALGDRPYAYKAHALVDREGPEVVVRMKNAGAGKVFVDLKIHDIPSIAKQRAEEWVRHGADLITAHVSGGLEMLDAVCESGARILGVTVLTSLGRKDAELIFHRPAQDAVPLFALHAASAGCFGVVCSSHETEVLRSLSGLDEIRLVTPGIRMAGDSHDDQKRVNTPAGAVNAGSDILVIGSAITKAEDPVAAFDRICADIESVTE